MVLALVGWCLFGLPPAQAEPGGIGVVTLVAGNAVRVDREGREFPLVKGDRVYQGDHLRTGTGGLAHVRFDDGAYAGLRAQSELHIGRYEAEPPAIELTLARGAVRQISGGIARQSPQSYRLNTPIAAIGVRGTDFVGGVDADRAYALLLEGAILVTPGACGVGTCSTTVLDQPKTMITVGLTGEVNTRPVDPAEMDRLTGAQRLARAPGQASAFDAPDKNREVAQGVTAPVQRPPELVWTRWLATGRFPESFAQEAGKFDSTGYALLATNLNYALWRREVDAGWTQGAGSVDFRLSEGAARFVDGVNVLPIAVEGGRLSVDFDRSSFATSLVGRAAPGVSVPAGYERLAATGTLINMQGVVNHEGRLTVITPNATLFGAIAHDKSVAGYLFNSMLPEGRLEGATLWKR